MIKEKTTEEERKVIKNEIRKDDLKTLADNTEKVIIKGTVPVFWGYISLKKKTGIYITSIQEALTLMKSKVGNIERISHFKYHGEIIQPYASDK